MNLNMNSVTPNWCKKNSLDPANYMIVVPVPFSTMGGQMLQHAKALFEDDDNLIAIHKCFDKLLTGLDRSSNRVQVKKRRNLLC
jgi:hypothetical protein